MEIIWRLRENRMYLRTEQVADALANEVTIRDPASEAIFCSDHGYRSTPAASAPSPPPHA